VSGRHTAVRSAAPVIALVLLLSGCAGDQRADHGPDVPRTAAEALGCAGAPYLEGRGNYDTGPESVQDDPREALDDWLAEEGYGIPDVEYSEEAHRGGAALVTWATDRDALAAFVVRDGVAGAEGDRGWGVASYAVCDPADWPPAASDAAGIEVWSDAEGDRVPTSLIQSAAGPAHCGWETMTFLFLGVNGADGEFYGSPDDELQRYLSTTYQAHASLPEDARDTGYRREDRELWLAADGSAAYLVAAEGDAERWPAPAGEPIRCA
jgi:hypothetical protein